MFFSIVFQLSQDDLRDRGRSCQEGVGGERVQQLEVVEGGD